MTSLVEIRDATREWRASGAELLRELADLVENGDVSEFVVVTNRLDEGCFEARGHFEDRWRILGAIEYAKQSVSNG